MVVLFLLLGEASQASNRQIIVRKKKVLSFCIEMISPYREMMLNANRRMFMTESHSLSSMSDIITELGNVN